MRNLLLLVWMLSGTWACRRPSTVAAARDTGSPTSERRDTGVARLDAGLRDDGALSSARDVLLRDALRDTSEAAHDVLDVASDVSSLDANVADVSEETSVQWGLTEGPQGTCASSLAGGIVVTTQPHRNAALAGSSHGLVVTWVTERSASGRAQRPLATGNVTRLESETLRERGTSNTVVDLVSDRLVLHGLVPVASEQGEAVAWCIGTPDDDTLDCTLRALDETALRDRFRWHVPKLNGCPPTELNLVAHAGATATLLGLGLSDGTLLFSSLGKAEGNARSFTTDCDSESVRSTRMGDLRALGDGRFAMVALHEGNRVELSRISPDGSRVLGNSAVSKPDVQCGTPHLATAGNNVAVTFAERATQQEPWHLVLITQGEDGTTTRSEPVTRPDSVVAPDIVSSDTAGCSVVSWVEQKDNTSRTFVGRVCNATLDEDSVAQLSPANTRATNVRLARDGLGVVAMWTSAEGDGLTRLRLARLGCR